MSGKSRKNQAIRVAVAGLGHVGRETARLLNNRARANAAAAGAPVRLAAVCDLAAERKARQLGLPKSVRRLRSYSALLDDPDIDIIVELFGGLRDARRLVLGALAGGKHVVTANKHLLSRHWDEVFGAANRAQRRIYFEAAVAGGIPILSALRVGLAANSISSVYGIFNGTTNYILSQMAHEGCEMRTALREAQRLGMAERNPTLDLDGSDTMHKVAIIASLLTGRAVSADRIPRQGIEDLAAEDMRFAVERLGHTVRLVGTVGIDWKTRPLRLETHVQPTLLRFKHPLAAVHGGYNAVLVHTSSAEDLMFYGKGAGPGPAASAVVGDILALGRIITGAASGGAPALGPRAAAPRHVPESDSSYYLKLRVRDVPGALSRITGILGKNGISIAAIHQPGPSRPGRAVPVMITTHATSRARIDQARRAVTRLSTVARRHTCLRFLPG
ncbi:MAG: homoserine dehydrogenase [Elusimicrobiota bacterium]